MMARVASTEGPATQPFVLVAVAHKRRLVRLSEVSEIVPMVRLEASDEARGRCRGLLNLRGEVVPVFDLAGPDAPLTASRFILVACAETGPFGVLVDDVVRVLHVSAKALAVRSVDANHTLECAELDGELVTVLRLREVVSA